MYLTQDAGEICVNDRISASFPVVGCVLCEVTNIYMSGRYGPNSREIESRLYICMRMHSGFRHW